MYHHKHVKKFYVEGVIYSDDAIPRFKIEYIRMLNESMRDLGYAMRIDISPDFTIHYNGNGYDFQLSVYGSYIGRKKVQWIEYLDGSTPLMAKAMLPASLQPQE